MRNTKTTNVGAEEGTNIKNIVPKTEKLINALFISLGIEQNDELIA